MRLEDLREQYPDPPEFIHQMIMDEVEKQIKSSTANRAESAGIRKRRKRPWTFRRTAAAVLAACLAIGAVGFAAVSIYHLQMEEKGKYGVDTKVTVDADKDESISLPEKIADVRIQADYIPEGMSWVDDHRLKYDDDQAKPGFSIFTNFMEGKSDEINFSDKNVVEKEKTDFGDHEGIYLKIKTGAGFSQKIYLLYPELYRILTIYIGDDVSKKEAYKVASGIKLVETGEMLDTSELQNWSSQQEKESGKEDESMTSIPKKDIAVYDIGTAFTLKDLGTDMDGNILEPEESGRNIEVTVDSVEVLDDASFLEPELISNHAKENIGSDGKILKNQLSYIKRGDGINTLDEIIRTEEVSQKLVLTTVTYTNKGDQELENVCYFGNMLLINETNEEYRIYSYDGGIGDIAGGGYDEISGQAYDHIEQTGYAGREMMYCSPRADYGMGGNYISALRPGESVQVKMAWITNEKDLEHIYLNLCATGGMVEFDKYMTATGIVDIRQ